MNIVLFLTEEKEVHHLTGKNCGKHYIELGELYVL